jgi:pyruvate-formate lyase-activating enzyme
VIGLAYSDARGRIFFDEGAEPLGDGGVVRSAKPSELIRAPQGTVPVMLPGRRPLLAGGRVERRRTALAALLPAGYTRLLLPAYESGDAAPALPLFGYTFACVRDDELYVAAMHTDEREDWLPRSFAEGEMEAHVERRIAVDARNRVLAQLAICARENVFLETGEAALPASPRCNARCVGCISELEPDAGIPSPQKRIAYETTDDELVRIAVHHLERMPDGIVSFGQGCEGEPLLRPTTLARATARIRAARTNGTINCNTNGSRTKALGLLIDAGLDAVRISLNSFRPAVYAAYYRPQGYALDDVLASIRLAAERGLRVSLNLLTHPGVTDDEDELEAMESFLAGTRIDMIQTRTLNIDPAIYFAAVGRPRAAVGMRTALRRIRDRGVRVGNFTHTH